MANTTKKTATAVTSADKKVKELFQIVQNKKAALANASKPCWNTSCSFGYSANSVHDRINIQTVQDVRKLIEMAAFINERSKGYNEAAKELGLEKEFSWLGFTPLEWKKDLQIRVDQLNFVEKNKELNTLETRLNSLVSPELKAAMELEEISELLKHN